MRNNRVKASVLTALTVLAAFPVAFGAVVSAAPMAEVHILDWDGSVSIEGSGGNAQGGGTAADYVYKCNGVYYHFNIPVRFYCNGVRIYPITTTPPPPVSAQTTPWGITAVGASKAWPTSRGAGVKVAVIDTGIQSNHPDLAANIKGGIHFYQSGASVLSDSNWEDDNGHGTHVAGTIAALDNTKGVVGVAPDVELYAVKVLSSTGSGTWDTVAAGVRWAADHGMNVASMSIGGSVGSQTLADAISYAYGKGVVLVAAAGNGGDGSSSTIETSYPAAYPEVIAVGAVDATLKVASFSSSAPYVALCGPGVSVNSTYKGSTYKLLSGTSMATPHVSATAALVLRTQISTTYDANSNGVWDPAEVKAKLQASAVDLGVSANFCGSGLVKASAAVV